MQPKRPLPTNLKANKPLDIPYYVIAMPFAAIAMLCLGMWTKKFVPFVFPLAPVIMAGFIASLIIIQIGRHHPED